MLNFFLSSHPVSRNHFEGVDDSDTECENDSFDNMNSVNIDVDQESFDNNIGTVQEDENVSQMYQIKSQ